MLAQAAATRLQAEHAARLADATEANLAWAKELQERLAGHLGAPPVVSAEGQGLVGDRIVPAGPRPDVLEDFLKADGWSLTSSDVSALRQQVRFLQADRDSWRRHAEVAHERLRTARPPVVSPQRVPAGACGVLSPGGGSVCALPPHGVEVRHEDGSGGSWLTTAKAPPFVCRSRLRTGDKKHPVVVCMRADPHTADGEHRSGHSGTFSTWTWTGDDPRVVSPDDKVPATGAPEAASEPRRSPGADTTTTEPVPVVSDGHSGRDDGIRDWPVTSEWGENPDGPPAGGHR